MRFSEPLRLPSSASPTDATGTTLSKLRGCCLGFSAGRRCSNRARNSAPFSAAKANALSDPSWDGASKQKLFFHHVE